MIKSKNELNPKPAPNAAGETKLYITDLADFEGRNKKLRNFSLVELKPGESVSYHVHNNEFESYYIISGKGLYDDNGVECEVLPGTVTFTPSGQGHGIKNIGDEMLEFIALIILD